MKGKRMEEMEGKRRWWRKQLLHDLKKREITGNWRREH